MKSEGGARKSFGERRGKKVGDPPSVHIKREGGRTSFGERRGGKVGDPRGHFESEGGLGESR